MDLPSGTNDEKKSPRVKKRVENCSLQRWHQQHVNSNCRRNKIERLFLPGEGGLVIKMAKSSPSS